MKIIPLRVEKIAESWNMEQGKGEIDYTKYRPVGHKLTLKEKEYIDEVLIDAKTKIFYYYFGNKIVKNPIIIQKRQF